MAKISLEELLTKGGFSASEQDAVKKGKLVKGVMDSLSERELAVKFAFKVPGANLANVPEAFMDSRFKKIDPAVYEVGHVIEEEGEGEGGGGDDAKLFADLKLEPNTDAALKLYRNAGPGDDLNLSADEIEELNQLGKDASREAVEALIQKQLTKRYQQYRELGMSGIAPYQRSKTKSYNAGEELSVKTELMPVLQNHVPEVYKYILEYPQAPKPDGLMESFSWTVSVFDDLPTIALVHKVGYLLDDFFVYFQRMFYVSRSHNSVQGVGGVFPCPDDPDKSSIFVYGTRTSTDKVAGFGGAAKRTIGARIMSSKQAENFEKLQQIGQQLELVS